MPFLTKEQAQQIVDKMRPTIQHDINIMDEKGIIIASSDEDRIGKVHELALKAMRENKAVTVYENFGDMKVGINMPISFQERIVGVIGISGDVEKTSNLIQLMKITVDLLVNQQYLMNTRQIKQQLIEQFLYEWVYRTAKYSAAFINRGLSLTIDVRVQRRAVILRCADGQDLRDSFAFLGVNDFFLRVNPNEYIIFLACTKSFDRKLKSLLELCDGCQLGVGSEQYDMYLSSRQAQSALQIGILVQPEQHFHRFEDLQHHVMLFENSEETLLSIHDIEKLISLNNNYNLLETLVAFIQNDGEMNHVAEQLHIHRNSLNYRLERIAEITGKNPKKYNDLFYLYCAYIAYLFREVHPSQLPSNDY